MDHIDRLCAVGMKVMPSLTQCVVGGRVGAEHLLEARDADGRQGVLHLGAREGVQLLPRARRQGPRSALAAPRSSQSPELSIAATALCVFLRSVLKQSVCVCVCVRPATPSDNQDFKMKNQQPRWHAGSAPARQPPGSASRPEKLT
eukprot:815447-Rhodomonas_salina.1